jgi:beta-carotene hydroxylase
MTWWRALLDGVTLQPRLWVRAWSARRQRGWLAVEAAGVAVLLGGSVVAIPWTIAPCVYVSLMIGGSWIFPLVTSFVPHDPDGDSVLTRTRLFRGRFLAIVAVDHLYHLEHHLYPQVPHHNWPELARRLDPHFTQRGVRAIRVFF